MKDKIVPTIPKPEQVVRTAYPTGTGSEPKLYIGRILPRVWRGYDRQEQLF